MMLGDGGLGGSPRPMAARLPSPWDPLLISPCDGGGRGGSRTAPTGWAKGEGVGAAVGVVAVNFGHPPARCARVPLRGAKGGVTRM